MDRLEFNFKKNEKTQVIRVKCGAIFKQSNKSPANNCRNPDTTRSVLVTLAKHFVRAKIEQHGVQWKLVMKHHMLYLTAKILEEGYNKYDHFYVSTFIEYTHRLALPSDRIVENRIVDFTNLSLCHTIDRHIAGRIWLRTGKTALRKVVVHLRTIKKWRHYNKFLSSSHRGADFVIKLNGKELFVHSQILSIHSAVFLEVLGKEENVEDSAISKPYYDSHRMLKCCDVTWDEDSFIQFLGFMYGDDFLFRKNNVASLLDIAVRFKASFHIARIAQFIGESGMTLTQKMSLAWKYKLISLLVSLRASKEFTALITLIPQTEFFSLLAMREKDVLLSYLSSKKLRYNTHLTVEFTIPQKSETELIVVSNRIQHFFFQWFIRVFKEGNRYAYNLCSYSLEKNVTSCFEIYNYEIVVGVLVNGEYLELELSNVREGSLFVEHQPRRTTLAVDFKHITITVYELACHYPVSVIDVPGHGLPDTVLRIGDLRLFAYSQVLKLYSPKFNITLRPRKGGTRVGSDTMNRHFLSLSWAPQSCMELLFSMLTLPGILVNCKTFHHLADSFIVLLTFCKIHYMNIEHMEKLFVNYGLINNRMVCMRFFYMHPVLIWTFDLGLFEKHLSFLITVGDIDVYRVRSSIPLKEYRTLSSEKRKRIDMVLNSGKRLYTV